MASGSLIYLVVILIVNLFGARSYGEVEYWMSLVGPCNVITFIRLLYANSRHHRSRSWL